MFSEIDRKLIDNEKIVLLMDLNDKYNGSSIVHLKLY